MQIRTAYESGHSKQNKFILISRFSLDKTSKHSIKLRELFAKHTFKYILQNQISNKFVRSESRLTTINVMTLATFMVE